MAGPRISVEGWVLLKRAPADAFQTLTIFSAGHGSLIVLQRISKKSPGAAAALDLFDEASLLLETSNQGQTWFVQEARLLTRLPQLGRSYDTLQGAAALAQLVARNAVPEESRARVYRLLHEAFAAFAASDRPDIVYLKSLYRFARDEGYPVKEQWFSNLSVSDRETVAILLNQPMASQNLPPPAVTRLRGRLEDYLRGHTEILPG